MTIPLSAPRLRHLCTVYIGFVALVTLTFAVINARVTHPWIIGEWLINYSGGFLRRGLLGECLLLVHRLTQLPLIGLTASLQIGLYSAFYASLIPLLRGVRWSLPLLALLLSPATLAFTVLDPPTSVRKEILLFLALSLLVNLVVSRQTPAWQISLAIAIVSPMLVLTHEALLAFLPYLFLPLLLATPRPRDAIRFAPPPILFAALAFAAAVTHPGGGREAAAICASIGGHLDHQQAGICSGAIAYLRFTPAAARAETLRAIHFYSYRTRYPLPILLTCLPIAWRLLDRVRHPGNQRAGRLLLTLTALSVVASLPLFVIARDWGRWMEIHATCLLLLFLLLDRLHHSEDPDLSTAADLSVLSGSTESRPDAALSLRPVSLVGLVLYATCWTLPSVGIFPGRFGYLDLARYLATYHSKPHLTTTAPRLPSAALTASAGACNRTDL